MFGRFDLAALCGCRTLNFCLFVCSPAGDLFAVSVVGCLLGYSSCLVVWIPLFLDPSDGVFGRFDLAALCGCRTLNFCLFVNCHLTRRLGFNHHPPLAHLNSGCSRQNPVDQYPARSGSGTLLQHAGVNMACLTNLRQRKEACHRHLTYEVTLLDPNPGGLMHTPCPSYMYV